MTRAGAATGSAELRQAGQLKAERELRRALEQARREAHGRWRANTAWRAVRKAFVGLDVAIEKAGPLPACPARIRAELAARWLTVWGAMAMHLHQHEDTSRGK